MNKKAVRNHPARRSFICCQSKLRKKRVKKIHSLLCCVLRGAFLFVMERLLFKEKSAEFTENLRLIYPDYSDNDRVDILIKNTDFGVGD